jgi:serine/threonine protein kinase
VESLTGSRLGRFRIDRLIGKGGMSEVYAAADESLDREVAVKVLGAKLDVEPHRRRFLREARLAARLNHPNIASIHEIGDSDGHLYIVMELLEGETLRSLLAKRRLTREECLSIGRDIARALARAHAGDVIHRDIKPENIFITHPSPDVVLTKVLDFGLARDELLRRRTDQEATATDVAGPGEACGTAGYLAPEQARGVVVDIRADIFSFGAVMYEMLTGKRAFDGRNHLARMLAVVKQPAPQLRQSAPNLAPELEALVDRCLAKAPEDRFPDGASLLAALERVGWGDPDLRSSKPFLAAPIHGAEAPAMRNPPAIGVTPSSAAVVSAPAAPIHGRVKEVVTTTASPTTRSNPPGALQRPSAWPLLAAGACVLAGSILIVLAIATRPKPPQHGLVASPLPVAAREAPRAIEPSPATTAIAPTTPTNDEAASSASSSLETPAPANAGAGRPASLRPQHAASPRTTSSVVPPSSAPAHVEPPKFGTIRIQSDVMTVVVDGEHRRVKDSAVVVPCGRHKVRAGFQNERVVDVPCGGTVGL